MLLLLTSNDSGKKDHGSGVGPKASITYLANPVKSIVILKVPVRVRVL